MAEITKLSVSQALDKLRGTDAAKSKITQLEEKIDAVDQDIQRLRSARRRVERDRRNGSTKRD
jgi:hypothetical protein